MVSREIRAEQRERVAAQKVVRLRVRALGEHHTPEERAAANAEANRVANLLRERKVAV